MSFENQADSPRLESRDQLREYFTSACKSRDNWRLGTEYECFGVYVDSARLGQPPPYDGPAGIGATLEGLSRNGWTPVLERDRVIALARGDAQVTIEPGGQFELSARPVVSADEMKADLTSYQAELQTVSDQLGLAWLGLGFRPFGSLDDVSWMPKQRYEVMRAYMPTVGTLGHHMMKRTATVQVNIDYDSVDDAANKLRAAYSVTSILTAMFASSPIVDGALTDYQSYRARIWRDTDNARCGLLGFVFEDRDMFDAYIDWALDVPLYFVHRGSYIPAHELTFRQFMADGFQDYKATIDDWALHLSTLFPETRMKRFIEVRGCDCGSPEMVLALGPLCRALFYDDTALRHAIELTAGLDFGQRNELADRVPREGMATPVGDTGRTIGELATDVMAIATDALDRQAPGEQAFLDPLRAIVESGRTQADATAALWRETDGDPRAIIAHTAHITPSSP